MLIFYSRSLKKVTFSRPIQFPTGVTSVRHVEGVRGEDAPGHVLCEPLRHFRGLIAVGTVGGVVFCVDLMLDQPVDAEEALPSELFLVSYWKRLKP